LEKVRTARDTLGPGIRIELDGGVGPANAAAIRDAGGDVLAAASAIFARPEPDRPGVIRELRG
ncbi:MAG TPA: ribulose-phosphate 3-epimerase, partial [Phycisphaerales bacterium]|nr:ribulose-phosphate 3-epimerase [Phycisphaerales bacterium]